jgi:hypothetical protein
VLVTYREPPEGWLQFGTHAVLPIVPPLLFSEERDEVGDPLWERALTPKDVADFLWSIGHVTSFTAVRDHYKLKWTS